MVIVIVIVVVLVIVIVIIIVIVIVIVIVVVIVIVGTRFSLGLEMSGLTREGMVEPVSRDQNLRRERERGSGFYFP